VYIPGVGHACGEWESMSSGHKCLLGKKPSFVTMWLPYWPCLVLVSKDVLKKALV